MFTESDSEAEETPEQPNITMDFSGELIVTCSHCSNILRLISMKM